LVGTDGSMKMSKSLGNYIAIDESPNEIYGKVMSIPDGLMMDYFELLTDVSDEELAEFRKGLENDSVNPMVLKKRLAREIVEQFHNKKAAKDAEACFEKTVQRKEVPEEITEVQVSFQEATSRATTIIAASDEEIRQIQERVKEEPPHLLATLLTQIGLVQSTSEGRRLIEQGAVKIDGKVVTKRMVNLRDGMTIQAGKRRFVKIADADKRT
ncbi:MAG: hypothetical protein KAW13_02825, partial [Dehalococcoidia bacterium]|nr:hypothetical protein [Dehalococcoidia bacterium]